MTKPVKWRILALMDFQRSVFAHFHLCDPAGILFYGNYAAIGHQVLEEFIVAMGIPWREWFENAKWGIPIRKLDVEYRAPVWAGRTYQAKASVTKLGETSVEFQVNLFDESDNHCTQIRTVHVFIDLKSKQKMPIPDSFLMCLRKGL